MEKRRGPEHFGADRAEQDEARAERIIAEELTRRKWTEQTLRERLKGDVDKVRIAQRFRAETFRTVAWIAVRLHLGSRNYVNHLLWKRSE